MEIEAARLAARYGTQAVYGRVLGVGELRAMQTAEDLINAYAMRARSSDWNEWAAKNPYANRLLIWAEKQNV